MTHAARWFKHDTNARDDLKTMLLIDQLGLEGYGIFWILIETLVDQEHYRYPMEMLPVLAKRFNTSTEKIRTVILSYRLFEVAEDDTFASPALIRRMEEYEARLQSCRKSGSIGGKKRGENAQQAKRLLEQDLSDPQATSKQTPGERLSEPQTTLKQPDSDCSSDPQPIRLDEIRRDKKRKELPSGVSGTENSPATASEAATLANRSGETVFLPPDLPSVKVFFSNRNRSPDEAEQFYWNYERKGWVTVESTRITNWCAAAESWIANEKKRMKHGTQRTNGRLVHQQPFSSDDVPELIDRIANDPRLAD